jgi:hypothetical protein
VSWGLKDRVNDDFSWVKKHYLTNIMKCPKREFRCGRCKMNANSTYKNVKKAYSTLRVKKVRRTFPSEYHWSYYGGNKTRTPACLCKDLHDCAEKGNIKRMQKLLDQMEKVAGV